MGAVADLVAQVLAEGQFDADEATVLRWLNARQGTMVRDSHAYVKYSSAGTLVAGQGTYAVPAEIIEIERVGIGGLTGDVEVPKVDEGLAAVGEPGWSMSGSEFLRLWPAPGSELAGKTLVLRGKAEAPDLSVSDDGTLIVPKAYRDDLVSGAIATGLARLEMRPDLAQPLELDFTTAVGKFRRDVARKARGRGPAQIRVQR